MPRQNPSYGDQGLSWHYARHNVRSAATAGDEALKTMEPRGEQTNCQVQTLASTGDHPRIPSFSLAAQGGWHGRTTEEPVKTDVATSESPASNKSSSSKLPQAGPIPSATNGLPPDCPMYVLPSTLASSSLMKPLRGTSDSEKSSQSTPQTQTPGYTQAWSDPATSQRLKPDDYEQMIAAIMGEQPSTPARSRVCQDIIIPATAEKLRTLKEADSSKITPLLNSGTSGAALSGIPLLDNNDDALQGPGSMISSFPKHYAMESTMRHPALSVRKSLSKITPILLTPARRLERDALVSDITGPTRRVHFKIARNRDTSAFQPLEPGSVLVKRWLQLMVVPVTWEIWSFPFRLAFGDIQTGLNILVLKVDIAADVIFLCDIVVGLMTVIPASTFPHQPDIASSFSAIRFHRVRHELFWHLMPIFAYQLTSLILVSGGLLGQANQSDLHTQSLWLWWASGIPRLTQRLRRFSFYFESILVDPTINAQHLQAFRVALIIFLSAHWVGCVFYFLARLQAFVSTTWLADFEHLLPNYEIRTSDLAIDYLLCMYKGFNALSNLAYDLGINSPKVTALMISLFKMITKLTFENLNFRRTNERSRNDFLAHGHAFASIYQQVKIYKSQHYSHFTL